MKKIALFVLAAVAGLMCFTSCKQPTPNAGTKSGPDAAMSGQKSATSQMQVQKITVTSSSIDKSGKLLTETAADKEIEPPGSNKSPQLSWNAVDGAAGYAVSMYDDDAGWLHWFASGIKATSLSLGEYTDKEHYVGPYPPRSSGKHHYRIEVFALKQMPTEQIADVDADCNYNNLVKKLNQVGGKTDNILARGYIVGIYENAG